jgi:hypothetical protein
LRAAGDLYRAVTEARDAELCFAPPLRIAFVARALPPSTIVSSSAFFHESMFVERTNVMCTPRFRWIAEQS